MFNLPSVLKKQLTLDVLSKFHDQLKLCPVIGAEIEFYLDGGEREIEKFLVDLSGKFDVESEKGVNQYEVKLKHTDDILKISEQIIQLRRVIFEMGFKRQVVVYFNAKPFKDRPGSALHIHINFFNHAGANIFSKNVDGNESAELLDAVSGLCHIMQESMVLFAPLESSYRRFRAKQNAPTTVSWGGNNRTVAIRIPDSDSKHRRIEHRVASSEADPSLVILAILAGVNYGFTNELLVPEKIFGDASDVQHRLERLPYSLSEANERFEASYLGIPKLR
jgi:glutamine synthetase